MSCDKISQALPPLFFGAGQRSYMELLRGRRESLGTRLAHAPVVAKTRHFASLAITSLQINSGSYARWRFHCTVENFYAGIGPDSAAYYITGGNSLTLAPVNLQIDGRVCENASACSSNSGNPSILLPAQRSRQW